MLCIISLYGYNELYCLNFYENYVLEAKFITLRTHTDLLVEKTDECYFRNPFDFGDFRCEEEKCPG